MLLQNQSQEKTFKSVDVCKKFNKLAKGVSQNKPRKGRTDQKSFKKSKRGEPSIYEYQNLFKNTCKLLLIKPISINISIFKGNNKRDNVFKNRPNKICEKTAFKKFRVIWSV